VRILQEALSNIRKHSKATEATISFHQVTGGIMLQVADCGSGFDPNQKLGNTQHGLHSMRERAAGIGADFTLISSPGKGTTIQVYLPPSALKKEAR
jgi:signal transduction histidine kinase